MDDKADIHEKIVFEEELPPVEEPASVTETGDTSRTYTSADDAKFEGEKAYVKAGHGTVLVQEEGARDKALEKHDYYQKGFSGQQKEEMGKEASKTYEKDRDVDMLGRQAAPEYVQVKTQTPEKAPRKQKVEEVEKPKGHKIIENIGSKKFPERLARPDGINS